MFRLLLAAFLACAFALSTPALAQKKGGATKYVPRGQEEPSDDPRTAEGEDMPLPSREALEKSDLPGFAKCALNCSRLTQGCTARCKGNSACTANCQQPYLACAQRCGGPIGTDPRDDDNSGGTGGNDGNLGCVTGCTSQMNACKDACGGKAACRRECMDGMSACAEACN